MENYETPLFFSSIQLKENKTRDFVKLVIVLSRNKTNYLKRVFVYYSSAYTAENIVNSFSYVTTEKMVEKEKARFDISRHENTF